MGVKPEKDVEKKQMAGRGPSAEQSHDGGGVPWNFLLALLSATAVGVTTCAVCVNFEAPAEQIGQSARIIRRKLC